MKTTTKDDSWKLKDGPAGRPGPDGSVVVDGPTPRTRFDMGNRKMFAAFDGEGSLLRGAQTDGYDAGTWKLSIFAGGERVCFDSARALGRLWELRGRAGSLELTLRSFLDETGSGVHQRLEAKNGTGTVALRAELAFSPTPPTTPMQRFKDQWARLVALFPGAERWWATTGAKIIRPYAAATFEPQEGHILKTRGRLPFAWKCASPAALSRCGAGAGAVLGLDLGPGESGSLAWCMFAGGAEEAAAALDAQDAALESARDYGRWLAATFPEDDPELRCCYAACLNAAVSMFKEFPDGFSGLLAGTDYAYPPRLYFRDGYWTAQALLDRRPDLVRRHLLSLARGVHPNGQCPSGVFAPHVLRDHAGGRIKSLDWLPDHYDSPSLFALLAAEYVEATGDRSLLEERVAAWMPETKSARPASIWELARAAVDYLSAKDEDGDGLIEKPYKANDWADNVKRSAWVTYDQALYAAALRAVSRLAALRGEADAAADYGRRAEKARRALNDKLWDERLGRFVNYRRDGFVEDNMSLDTLAALRFGLVDEDKTAAFLEAARRLRTGKNPEQPYGRWGVMCAFPFYKCKRDLFSKSAFEYCYHNGADWPYLDGLYAETLRERGDPAWRETALEWWRYGLARGWLTPIEYYAPVHEPGGLLQGWSAMPAVAIGKSRA